MWDPADAVLVLLATGLLLLGATVSDASECGVTVNWPPWDYSIAAPRDSVSPESPRAVTPAHVMFAGLMFVYKTFVSPVSGKHCPMYPSCSSFCRDAVAERGVFLGVIMAFDRLHRCGHDLRFYEVVYLEGRQLRYDPVDSYNQGIP